MIALDTDLLVYAHREESPFHAAAFECVLLLAELPAHWGTLRALRAKAESVGPAVHDARIAALCLLHGVGELCRPIGTSAASPR